MAEQCGGRLSIDSGRMEMGKVKGLRVKNHYVPECYLKRWGDSGKKVHVYRTLVKHPGVSVWKLSSVSAIAYHKHLYTQVVAGRESDEIEEWLGREFESPANAALEKAVSDGRLSSDEWAVLIKFLAAQDVRTPARLFEHLRRAQKTYPRILQDVMSELKEKIGRGELASLKVESGDVARNVQPFPLRVSKRIEDGNDEGYLIAETCIGRSSWIYSIKRLLNVTRKVLHDQKWSIVKPAKGFCWPTSDNPVVKINYYGVGKYNLQGGWGVKNGNIFFPIGPEHAMFVQIGDRPMQKGTRLTKGQTIEFIEMIVENAHRMIFSVNENDDIPQIRKRVVDPQAVEREGEEMRRWHEENAGMERKYMARN